MRCFCKRGAKTDQKRYNTLYSKVSKNLRQDVCSCKKMKNFVSKILTKQHILVNIKLYAFTVKDLVEVIRG